METKNNNLLDNIEELNIKLERIEAYNNLIANFLESIEADANSSEDAPLLFLSNVRQESKDYLIINYTLAETLEGVKKTLARLEADAKK